MSADVETMFSSRRVVPWHGLGVILDNPPTAEDAIVAAGLDWSVVSKPIYVNGDTVPGYSANVRSTDNKVLGIVSSRYSIVQNADAFTFLNSLVGVAGLTFETAGSLNGGKRIWLLCNMPEVKILDDEFIPYLCFTNSFNGQGAVTCACVTTRVVCANTLNFALNTAKRSWSTKHVGDIAAKLAEAKMTLGLANNYISALQQDAEVLAAQKITDAEVDAMLDAIYLVKEDDSDIRKARIAKAKESFFTCLAAPDIANYKGTAFAVMNAATDFVDHAQPMRLTQNFEENRWGQIIVGHPFVDQMYKMLKAA